MSTTTNPKYPTAVYAVAGAGDLAYRELLNALPMVTGLSARVEALRAELPGRVERRVERLRAEFPVRVATLPDRVAGLPARVEQLRTEVPAAVNTFVAEAVQVYSDLVVRGTKVVDGPRPTTSPVKKAGPAKRATAKKAPANKATKATVTKATVTKAPVTKAPAKRAPAKKTAK
jgi:heparin binding hemagglutinin HbhA